MKQFIKHIATAVVLATMSNAACGQDLTRPIADLIETSCIGCHDSSTDTGLDFESVTFDLSEPNSFDTWEKVFDRVNDGEMPPASESRPNEQVANHALATLRKELSAASLSRQEQVGRVPARRLTKMEMVYTLQDLLHLNLDLADHLPDEAESETFDTVGVNQRISSVHMESYLKTADRALEAAITLESNPFRKADISFDYLKFWHDKPLMEGGGLTRELKYGRGVALFRDVDYLTQFRFAIHKSGLYKLKARVAAYQSKTPVTAKLIVKSPSGEARLVKSLDLPAEGDPQDLIVESYFDPGDYAYLTFDTEGKEPYQRLFREGGARNYSGRGLAILSQKMEGPLYEQWPPPGTRKLLGGIELKESRRGEFTAKLTLTEQEHVKEILGRLASEFFRRPVEESELAPFVAMSDKAFENGRGFLQALRLSMRSMLTSPQFLLFDNQPGKLGDYQIANRLSYFLWKSMPDEALFELAERNQLSEPGVLRQQVERMLKDKKSKRFLDDFVGQWLRLNQINATTPDDGLYPEFDELLADAIPQETNLFFAELVEKNLSLDNLVDSDFTFVNRRLAKHYQLEAIEGQDFRRVTLPKNSPRGGLLTQAAILKTTANGTTTSPVMRGNFVLANLLGTPPSPPPPGIGSIEPDTRGKTTIREILKAHRDIKTCAACHDEIDPPGFALESFDPIGGFRTYYRASGGKSKYNGFVFNRPPKRGPKVDPSGTASDGSKFSDIREFKQLLLERREQIARNFVEKLLVYSTGAEIQFSDRDEVEQILNQTREDQFRVRDLIHAVVQCEIFKKG